MKATTARNAPLTTILMGLLLALCTRTECLLRVICLLEDMRLYFYEDLVLL